MKIALLCLIFFFLPKFSFEQLANDSLLLKEKERDSFSFIRSEVFNSGWKKNNHLLDYQTIGLITANAGAVGYTYLYKPFERWKFGMRVGGWYRETRDDKLVMYARKRYIYSVSFVFNYSIWKGFNIHYENGLSQVHSQPMKTNTKSLYSKWEEPSFDQRIMLNSIWLKHLALNFGFQIRYYHRAKFWGSNPCLSIGIKI